MGISAVVDLDELAGRMESGVQMMRSKIWGGPSGKDAGKERLTLCQRALSPKAAGRNKQRSR